MNERLLDTIAAMQRQLDTALREAHLASGEVTYLTALLCAAREYVPTELRARIDRHLGIA